MEEIIQKLSSDIAAYQRPDQMKEDGYVRK
jgi:hypothetical protein